jgi:hypothetical protein
MAVAEKIAGLITELQGLQSDVEKLEQQPASSGGGDASAPAAGSADSTGGGSTIDPQALADLQAKVDALGKERDGIAAERDAYKAAIQAEIDDQKADSARLEKAIAKVDEVPVEVEVPTVPSPDAAATPVNAGISG